MEVEGSEATGFCRMVEFISLTFVSTLLKVALRFDCAMKKTFCSLLGLIVLVCHPASAAVITYDSTVLDWYANGMTASRYVGLSAAQLNPYITFTPPTNSILANGYGGTTYYPFPAAGSYGGATWEAPEGEAVIRIDIFGSFRSEMANQSDFVAAIYGGSSGSVMNLLSSGLSFTYNDVTKRASYTWTITIDPNDGISALQFDAWRAVSGSAVIQAGGNAGGYSGSIDGIQIVTTPIPEPSTMCLLASVGIFGICLTLRGRGSKELKP